MATVPLARIADVSQGLSLSGHAAGARPGDWVVTAVESGDIQDDLLPTTNLRIIAIEQNARTEKHLLRPHDLLVTARSTTVKVALVPPALSRTVALSTLLVVRPRAPETGMSHYLWYFLTSSYGRGQVEARLSTTSTIASLTARNLGEVPVPPPPDRELHALAKLVQASETAYVAGLKAAQLRRGLVRDHIIHSLHGRAGGKIECH